MNVLKKIFGYIIFIIGLCLSIYIQDSEWSAIFMFLGIILITDNFKVLRNEGKK